MNVHHPTATSEQGFAAQSLYCDSVVLDIQVPFGRKRVKCGFAHIKRVWSPWSALPADAENLAQRRLERSCRWV